MKNFMLFLMTLFLSCHVMAQQTTVTGTITDGTDGSPLIGANGPGKRNRYRFYSGRKWEI